MYYGSLIEDAEDESFCSEFIMILRIENYIECSVH